MRLALVMATVAPKLAWRAINATMEIYGPDPVFDPNTATTEELRAYMARTERGQRDLAGTTRSGLRSHAYRDRGATRCFRTRGAPSVLWPSRVSTMTRIASCDLRRDGACEAAKRGRPVSISAVGGYR